MPLAPTARSGRSNRWLWLAPLLAAVLFLGGVAVGMLLIGQGVNSVREAAERERCAGQLKVLALGMRMYVMDHGAAPAGGNWEAALEARGIPRQGWVCPTRHDGLPYPVARHPDLARLQAGDRSLPVGADAPLPNGRGPHGGKFNVVYADGHVEEANQSPLEGGKGGVVTWRSSAS